MSKEYFQNFPTIDYRLSKTETKKAVDILRRVGISDVVFSDDRNLISGFIKDGATPQTVAKQFYGSEKYYWVVLLSSKIHNPFYGWPLEYQQLRERIEKEYPGVSLFVSSSDSGMNTKSESVNFTVGDIINVISGGSGEEVIVYSGTIYDYDLTSGHMKIKDIVGDGVTESYDTSQNYVVRSTTDPTKTGFLRRKIQDTSFSLFRFEDIETKREYSPLYRYSGSTTLISTYTNTTDTTLDQSGTLSSGQLIFNSGIKVITLEQREEEINDRNRHIKIIKPSLLSKLTNELEFQLKD
jgi:hypothetical protein